MRKTILLNLLLFAMGITACGQNPRNNQLQLKSETTAAVVPTNNLDEDIGEMLMVGFRGTKLEKDNHIVRDIQKYHVGSVILFEYDAPTGKHQRNISSVKQLTELCKSLQLYANNQLLIGVDQEGGKVSRLKPEYGFESIPSAKAMAKGGKDSVSHYARLTASMLKKVGINLDFAPVADVDVNPNCPVIGKLNRSFSSDPNVVTDYCGIWLDALKNSGIVGCMKHFPGHGSAAGDTHQGLVDISDTWSENELIPYQHLIAQGVVPMVMTGHLMVRQLDEKYPTSLSNHVNTAMLREGMGFEGVIVTDDLAMGAITKQYGFEEAIRLAIRSGVDMLCLSNNGSKYDENVVPTTVKIIKQMVESGEISPERIHQSAERIRKIKKQVMQ